MGAYFRASGVVAAAAWCASAVVLSAASGPTPMARCGSSAQITSSRGEAGSNSSKASTPIRRQVVAARPSAGATMSAKGSTPIRRGSGLLDVAGSGGASTAKASAPVAPGVVTTDCSTLATR
jgi:hypothetical protein